MNYANQMYAIKQSRIARLVIAETGTYNQQYLRPYNSVMDGQSRQQMLDAFSQSPNITPATVAGVSNRFIKPSAEPECAITISNGWGTQRLRFMMEVQHTDQMGVQSSEYVVGYTDRPGLSVGGALDPSMVFVVNAINTTRNRTQYVPGLGNQPYQCVTDASSILVNSQYSGVTGPSLVYALRPEDVYTQIDNAELQSGLDGEPMFAGRSMLTTRAIKSNRANAIAPTYVAKVLDAYLQSSRADLNADSKILNETARSSVKSLATNADPFLQFLQGKSQTQSNYQFTYADLVMLDPNVTSPNVTKVVPIQPAWQSTLHRAGQTSNWNSSDIETLFAVTISQSFPGYMLNYNLNKILLHSDNLSANGVVNTVISKYNSFSTGVDLSGALASLIFRLENELLKDLSYDGQISFSIDVFCDLLGDTQISLSLNGGPPVPYVTPSFCDSLLAPMTTSHNATLSGIASDFSSLMSEIADGHVQTSNMTASGLGFC